MLFIHGPDGCDNDGYRFGPHDAVPRLRRLALLAVRLHGCVGDAGRYSTDGMLVTDHVPAGEFLGASAGVDCTRDARSCNAHRAPAVVQRLAEGYRDLWTHHPSVRSDCLRRHHLCDAVSGVLLARSFRLSGREP